MSFPLALSGPSTAAEKKSVIRSFLDRHVGGMQPAALTKAKAHVIEGAHAVRQTAEGAVTGAALAVAHAEIGLDYKGVPLDGVLAGLGMLGRGYLVDGGAGSVGVDVGNIGAAAAAVFAFRKTTDFVHAKKAEAGQKPAQSVGTANAPAVPATTPAHGDIDEGVAYSGMGADPVLVEAERLSTRG